MEEKEFLAKEKQGLLDKMPTGLAKQGWLQSRYPDGRGCCYRGPDGLKCAVGHVIPDELYDPIMDKNLGDIGDVISFLSSKLCINPGGTELSDVMHRHYSMLCAVQEWHDDDLDDSLDRVTQYKNTWTKLKNRLKGFGLSLREPSYYEAAARG